MKQSQSEMDRLTFIRALDIAVNHNRKQPPFEMAGVNGTFVPPALVPGLHLLAHGHSDRNAPGGFALEAARAHQRAS
jgi:hypothetical protein